MQLHFCVYRRLIHIFASLSNRFGLLRRRQLMPNVMWHLNENIGLLHYTCKQSAISCDLAFRVFWTWWTRLTCKLFSPLLFCFLSDRMNCLFTQRVTSGLRRIPVVLLQRSSSQKQLPTLTLYTKVFLFLFLFLSVYWIEVVDFWYIVVDIMIIIIHLIDVAQSVRFKQSWTVCVCVCVCVCLCLCLCDCVIVCNVMQDPCPLCDDAKETLKPYKHRVRSVLMEINNLNMNSDRHFYFLCAFSFCFRR